ncbi:MAG: hypothetical protein GXO65_07105 [Euryarchaeota archaeon]|nr:hypothetical protein [Euryarchaeota archaeon]
MDGAAERPLRALALLLLLAGCAGAGESPECCEGDFGGLDLGYSCAKCGMAITDEMMGFSASLTREDGTEADFCTICCLLESGAPDLSRARVADYRTLEWVEITDAYYLKDSDIKTPMNCGIIAFKDRRTALDFRERHGGKILRFSDLMK